MRMSASGLESTIAVAIDHILRLAPSIRPPIEPVVSSTKATSTVGLAAAADRPAESERVAKANANERKATGFIVLLQCCVPGSDVPVVSRSGEVEIKAWRVRICGRLGPDRLFGSRRNRIRLAGNGIARPHRHSRARTGPTAVGDGAGDRARHRAAIAVAWIFLCQRIAAAVRTARRPGGAERARRDL